MEYRTVCFIGRRPKDLYGYRSLTQYSNLFAIVYCVVERLYQNGFTHFITDGEQGFDQLVFWAVDKLKEITGDYHIKNNLYAPCLNQSDSWLEDGLFGKEEYARILNRADNLLYVENITTPYPYKLNSYRKLINDSDCVVALFPHFTSDGYTYKTIGNSRTAKAMNYAESNKKPIIQISYNDDTVSDFSIIDYSDILNYKDIQTSGELILAK